MKATLQQIQDGFISLGKLASADLPVKTAYWLKRIAKAAEGEMKQLDEVRVQLVKKYGEEDAEGNVKVKDENLEPFANEFGELLKESIDLPGDPIALDRLGDVKLSALDLMRLDWLIIDGEGDGSTEAAKGAGA